ncbi:hypothetical protein SAMN02745168_2566 [Papillibacter cinnamivorans DSM 12816]|uniref:Uncharacterized protein n=2 Tax=Papillibacter TaxID=100175 RepID=A0A1W2C5P1_9FIRM|nr:hypothetical protein SAMN02745168_2566 [Papillibacter cinnamivorans DSM 12816]
MVPSLLIAPVTEGTSVAWLPALLLGTATAGDTYNTERRAGMPDRQAVIYSAAVGAVEGGLQYALGGIEAYGKEGAFSMLAESPAGNAALAKLDGVLRAAARSPAAQKALETAAAAGRFAIRMNDEGFEEYLQEILQPVIRNVVLGEDNEVKAFTPQALYAYVLGAITAGAFNAVSAAAEAGEFAYKSSAAYENTTGEARGRFICLRLHCSYDKKSN